VTGSVTGADHNRNYPFGYRQCIQASSTAITSCMVSET
jgi:hypothetical protein